MSKATNLKVGLWVWTIPLVALLGTALYVALAGADTGGFPGFPLDDAWIHQTYARNLSQSGQLAYVAGQPSAGSTSPAWSFALSVGYLLGVDYHLWAYLLGGLSLAASAWLVYRLFRCILPATVHGMPGQVGRPAAALLAGLFCALEWHLLWAAASGMETMLFTALSLALLDTFFVQVEAERKADASRTPGLQTEARFVRAVGTGLLGGILILTRPEGLGLVGLVVAGLLALPRPAGGKEVRDRLLRAALSLVILAAVLAPYVAFNYKTSGSLWPNTFYAKQTEYGFLRNLALPLRFWRVLAPTLVGAQVLLLPGFAYALYQAIRRRDWPSLLPPAWWLAFLSAYALRLPVDYQHGRYAMPSIPILLLYGSWGTAALLQPRSRQLAVRVLSRAAPAAIALLTLIFCLRGALAYRDDVAFIHNEMVATARWLNENTQPGDLIAVHDIGAVGYLTDRPLLDLAGLITPEVIPFMTDAQRLAAWMAEEGADYVVFFGDFSPTYALLADDPRLAQRYCTGYDWTRAAGHENMCVYQIQKNGRFH
jgi:hypothetical protein